MDLVGGRARKGFFVLPSQTVLKTLTERRTNRYRRLASKLEFAHGQREPLTELFTNPNHPELVHKSEEKSWGVWGD